MLLCAGKSGLMRLQFNKIGYEMYDKEQSRRVPAVRAKPGNPGYGFRRARWRDTMGNGEDRRACETVLRGLGVSQERLDRIRQRISDFREEWDTVRRPSRPAGPGRPRGHKRANASDVMEPMEAVDPMPEVSCAPSAGGAGVGPGGHAGAPYRKIAKKAAACKSKPLAGVAAKSGMGACHSAGSGAASGAGCAPGGGKAGGGWQPPPGAESPEDYMLPPAQADSGSGPVAAIVIDDVKSGLWQRPYHETDECQAVRAASAPPQAAPHVEPWLRCMRGAGDLTRAARVQMGNGVGHGYDEEEDTRHVHNLMDENSSLRSLNMSLIYEREKLLRELRQCDCEMASMQRAVDGLLQTSPAHGVKADKNSSTLCQAFRWLCNKLVRKRSNASDSQEIPAHLRQVLEACFDKYDEFQRQSQAPGDEDGEDDDDYGELGRMRDLGSSRGMASAETMPPLSCMQPSSHVDHPPQQHRDFNELAVSKNG